MKIEYECNCRDPWNGHVSSCLFGKQSYLNYLIMKARELPEMSAEQRNEQRASWAYGQMACMSEYRNASYEKLEELRRMCRKAAGCKP